jgi:hypothetical protein
VLLVVLGLNLAASFGLPDFIRVCARPRSLAMAERPAEGAAAPSAEARPNPSAPRNLSALAAVATEAGATRYDIPTPVTIPDKSATMVLLLSKRVPGESIFLFAPDGGVGDSQSHPFRVARFTNQSGGLLERGPIAIFEEGAFLGQGMVDPLPAGATTTVPFALERSLAVETQRTYTEEGARIAKIESGVLVIERDSVSRTRYRVKKGGDKSASPSSTRATPRLGCSIRQRAQRTTSARRAPSSRWKPRHTR